VVPAEVVIGGMVAGPNPVSRPAGPVNFYRTGKQIKVGVLTVYDPSGNVVNRVQVSDPAAVVTNSRRWIGSWNLRDSRGRLVAEGTYLVRGVVRGRDGVSERVSVVLGVR